MAEKLRAQIAGLSVESRDVSVRVTVSIGCAALAASDADPSAFFERCDQKAYAAKAAGRNRVAW